MPTVLDIRIAERSAASVPPSSFRQAWVSLLLTLAAIVCVKSVFLLIDSRPSYLFGDSEAYLTTATVGWIPPDRSFVYGLLLRAIAYRLHSLEAIIYVQALLSALASWILAVALARIFSVRLWL